MTSHSSHAAGDGKVIRDEPVSGVYVCVLFRKTSAGSIFL